MDKEKLKELVDDYGGGREKSNETSQMFYDITQKISESFHKKSYLEIELFAEYFKQVMKIITVYDYWSPGIKPDQNI